MLTFTNCAGDVMGRHDAWYISLYYGQNAEAPKVPGEFAIAIWSSEWDWRTCQDFVAGVIRKDIGRIDVEGIGTVFEEIRDPTKPPAPRRRPFEFGVANVDATARAWSSGLWDRR